MRVSGWVRVCGCEGEWMGEGVWMVRVCGCEGVWMVRMCGCEGEWMVRACGW